MSRARAAVATLTAATALATATDGLDHSHALQRVSTTGPGEDHEVARGFAS
jgi:hypothetical protein